MKTILKFTLADVESQSVQLPKGSEILTVQVQNDKPCMWALADKENDKETINILTVETGDSLSDNFEGKHIGTYQLYNGIHINHVFVVKDFKLKSEDKKMKTIWKFDLIPVHIQRISVPIGSEDIKNILTLQVQNEIPRIWVLVDTKNGHSPKKGCLFSPRESGIRAARGPCAGERCGSRVPRR